MVNFSLDKFSDICNTLATVEEQTLVEFLALYNISAESHRQLKLVRGNPQALAQAAITIMRLRQLMGKAPYGDKNG